MSNRGSIVARIRDCRRAGGRGEGGFTMAELIMVMLIISLLATMLLPAINAVRISVRIDSSLATINALDGACGMYRNDYDSYPPSNADAYGLTTNNGWYGFTLLPLFLTGFGADAGNDNVPSSPIDLLSDDGQEGFGIRTGPRSRVKGPYNGVEQIQTTAVDDQRRYFVDSFGNHILYYRFDTDPNQLQYHPTDNQLAASDVDSRFWYSGGKTTWPGPTNAFDSYVKNPNGKFFSRTFVLFSAGPDHIFSPPGGVAGLGDDITSFTQKQAIFSEVY